MNDRRDGRGRGGLQVVGREAASETRPEAIPSKQIRCRAGHPRFPMDAWEPPAPIPAGVIVMFASEGRYKLMEPCQACWAVTGVTYTHPGGGIDGYLRRQLVYGGEWVRMAQGTPRGKGLMRDTLYARGREQLQAFIGKAITDLADEDREAEPGRPPAAPVRFKGA
jgi:hypothetical protein